jgi:hypothetical protein
MREVEVEQDALHGGGAGDEGEDLHLVDRSLVGLGLPDGDHGGPEAGVGSQDPVVAVPMDAWGWYELGQAVEECEGGEAKHRGAKWIRCL